MEEPECCVWLSGFCHHITGVLSLSTTLQTPLHSVADSLKCIEPVSPTSLLVPRLTAQLLVPHLSVQLLVPRLSTQLLVPHLSVQLLCVLCYFYSVVIPSFQIYYNNCLFWRLASVHCLHLCMNSVCLGRDLSPSQLHICPQHQLHCAPISATHLSPTPATLCPHPSYTFVPNPATLLSPAPATLFPHPSYTFVPNTSYTGLHPSYTCTPFPSCTSSPLPNSTLT